MYPSFVATTSFEHEVDRSLDTTPSYTLSITKGDQLSLTEERRYVKGIGWCIKVFLNGEDSINLAIKELENLYQEEFIRSLMDVQLDLNYCQFKVDKALDDKDKETFDEYVAKLENLEKLLPLTTS
ncbi:hypothetical protein GLW08_03425 [Pontibacillus yanchengensis]|uniref:Uncharacterized protein n=2 Tax=Pontibacillus yanchengensis TaxID=462910 RepID=A0ACC7VCJ8_9BACI|nr:hypothetical protein [Pontibacillus yanchengensis]MYL35356.1 hypothetical protein [Pontibacillus yanchengensis]MYL52385.1 hypothetical protein [Pontibacillus yanchengensis]